MENTSQQSDREQTGAPQAAPPSAPPAAAPPSAPPGDHTPARAAEPKPETTQPRPDPEAGSAATEGAESSAGAGGEGGEGATTSTGAPRKRRRGKRGGRRHKKKPAGEGTTGSTDNDTDDATDGDDGDASSSTDEQAKPAAQRRPQQQRQPRPAGQRQPRSPRPKPADAGSAESPADGPADVVTASETGGEAETAETSDETGGDAATGAPKRRRRRGGRGRGKKPAGAGQTGAEGEGPTEDDAADKPAAKPAAASSGGGSTRLAARKMRSQQQQQRGRRPRKRLTEEDARALRGGEKMMLVHEHEDRTQIAVLEENALIEHFVARRGHKTSLAGNVFLGKVQNVLPGMEAAFIDFGRGRNGVLYAGEVNYSPEDLEGEEAPRIEKVLRSGQALMVQVTKDPIGAKGARLTTQISLAGRYMVLAPEQAVTGISRRLAENERNRLRQILRDIRPNGHGVIIRTAAEGASKEALERDLNNLIKRWEEIQKAAKKAKAPASLYAEPELTTKVVRDIFSGDFAKVIVDARGVYDDIKAYLEETAPDLLDKLELHEGALPLFETYRVTEQLHKALERKVWLPSGGSLVIDRTEAMTVIDVNTGKFVGKGSNLEETVYKNNLEAAEEVARQLRLRDIGGIIVIDFIDMIDPKNQQELLRTLKRALSRDKTRSQVFEVSNLGLVEMTRKKVSEGLLDAFSEPCPNCEGRGIVITHEIN